MLGVFATAFALGLVFNAAPGPVFAATVRYGARGGFRPALLVQLGSTLIVDGDIYVNSSNGNKSDDPNSPVKLDNWRVGGDGFDIFGAGGTIMAERIFVVGGWETHDGGIAKATTAGCPAAQRPDPLAYGSLNPPVTSNVCIRQPVLAVLSRETPVFPERSEEDWTLVRTPSGQIGWVHDALLEQAEQSPARSEAKPSEGRRNDQIR